MENRLDKIRILWYAEQVNIYGYFIPFTGIYN